jgi:hypothetical protein
MLKSDDLLHFQVKIIFLYNLEEIYFHPHNKIKKKQYKNKNDAKKTQHGI